MPPQLIKEKLKEIEQFENNTSGKGEAGYLREVKKILREHIHSIK